MCHQSAEHTATICDISALEGGGHAHIGVLSIDAGNQIGKTMFLLILIRDEQGITLNVAKEDFESAFVCNPVAISEGRGARRMVAGHIMENDKGKKTRKEKIII